LFDLLDCFDPSLFTSYLSNTYPLDSTSTLSLLYYVGLLMKVAHEGSSAASEDLASLGDFMVALVTITVLLVLFAMAFELRNMVNNLRAIRSFAQRLSTLNRADPADNTRAFYAVQNPVLPMDVGMAMSGEAEALQPKQPPLVLPNGSKMTAAAKVVALQQLTIQNEKILNVFFGRLNNDNTIELKRVNTPTEVNQTGFICVKHSHKTRESILQKSVRPSILAANPSYGVEHVRDSFRFKAVVYSFADALIFVRTIDRLLFEGGLSDQRVVKLDLQKLLTPKEWGWRFLAFDFRMPNGQLVENYIVFADMEHAKKNPDPQAQVCVGMGNHEIFERWRVKDVTKLSAAEKEEYSKDKKESNRRYYSAWYNTAERTTHSSYRAFWMPFGVTWHRGMLPAHHLDDDGTVANGSTTGSTGTVGFDLAMQQALQIKKSRSQTTRESITPPPSDDEAILTHPRLSQVDGVFFEHRDASAAHDHEPVEVHRWHSSVSGKQVEVNEPHNPSNGWHSASSGARVQVHEHHQGVAGRAFEAIHAVEHAAAGALHKAEHGASKAEKAHDDGVFSSTTNPMRQATQGSGAEVEHIDEKLRDSLQAFENHNLRDELGHRGHHHSHVDMDGTVHGAGRALHAVEHAAVGALHKVEHGASKAEKAHVQARGKDAPPSSDDEAILTHPRLSQVDGVFFEHRDASAAHDHEPMEVHRWHSSVSGKQVEVNEPHNPSNGWHSASSGARVQVHEHHQGLAGRALEAVHAVEHAAAGALHKVEHSASKALHKQSREDARPAADTFDVAVGI
jgi:hypothetical protein